VNPSLEDRIGDVKKIYYMFYIWGFTSAFFMYIWLSHFFPAPETYVGETVHDDRGETEIERSDSVEKRSTPEVRQLYV
jgi:hypothetical protein